MAYSRGFPVRLAGGRIALDLINTADWSADGVVVHEKIESLGDLDVWMRALGLPDAEPPTDVGIVHGFRRDLREAILMGRPADVASIAAEVRSIRPDATPQRQPLMALVALSALSILADPREAKRVKMCPGDECGWLFLDETRNGRRKWCLMETCGNRAKAARHYQRITRSAAKG